MSTQTLRHIAGSSFGLMLQSEECPIADPEDSAIDTSDWGVALRLVGEKMRLEIAGIWLESTGPWSMGFQLRDTLPWPVDTYSLRIVYTEPGDNGRRFEVETDVAMEVIR